MRDLACFPIVLCLLVGSVAGRDIYVNNTAGDDRFTGGQSRSLSDTTGPVQTLAKAIRLAGPGDHILLAGTGKPYRESFSLVGSRLGGMLTQPLVIDGNGAVLDGTAPIPPDQWKFCRDNVFRFRPPKMGGCQLFLDGRPAARVSVKPTADTPPDLDPRQWCAFEGHVYFGVELAKLPSDYKLTYASLSTGITLYHVEHVVIKDLTVQGFQIDGIQAQNSARRVTLDGVTCINNGRNGVTIGGASQVELRSCKIHGNGIAQLLTLPYSEAHIYTSQLLGDTAPAWVDQGGRIYLVDKQVHGGLETLQQEAAKPKPKAKPEDEKPQADSKEGPKEGAKEGPKDGAKDGPKENLL